jgi:ArsR family transcriptional regulator, arsenate/arsenite/antimonite-responsive transcriptional repressor
MLLDMAATELAQLRALAHPTRLAMVQRLAREPELCACDLGEAFDVSQPTISEHLRVLREAGLVRTRRDGTAVCYALDRSALVALGRLFAHLERQSERTQKRSRRRVARAAG